LILSDGKTGHLRQSQALAGLAAECLAESQITATVDTVEVSYRRLGRQGLLLSAALAGKYSCQGCLGCFKGLLSSATYQALVSRKYDCIISCGSALSALNYILARDNLAKSIVILRPSVFSVRKFSLVIMPRHDNPPKRSNVVVTDGALNLIDDDYLKQQGALLGRDPSFRPHPSGRYIGVLLGGNTKDFILKPETVKEMLSQVKNGSLKWNAGLMLTTSRRTPVNVETLVKQECKDFSSQSLLLIANEYNRDYAVGGILGLSSIVVVSAESISMISEAVSAGRYVIVCSSKVDERHRGFLEHMAGKRYIYLCEASRIQEVIDIIQKEKPPLPRFNDRESVREALKKIL
jgi:mitochondrial fission protein ELM1